MLNITTRESDGLDQLLEVVLTSVGILVRVFIFFGAERSRPRYDRRGDRRGFW